MKFLFSITLFCILVAATTAAESIGFYADPKHPGKCVVEGKVLSPGVHKFSDGSCGRMSCNSDGLVSFHDCGVMVLGPGLKVGEPLYPNEPYPKCCEFHIIEE